MIRSLFETPLCGEAVVAVAATSGFFSTRRAFARRCDLHYSNHMATLEDMGGTTTFTYDGNGNQTVVQKPNGEQASRSGTMRIGW